MSITTTFVAIFLTCFLSLGMGQQWQNSGFPDVTSVGFVAISGNEGEATAAFSDNTQGPGSGFSSDLGDSWSYQSGGWLNTGIDINENGDAVMSTIGKTFYRNGYDGTWTQVDGKALSFSQWVECFGDEDFSVAGDHYPKGPVGEYINGVAVTHDAGVTWDYFDIGLDSSNYPARYSSFPNKDVWYVTAGTWKSTPKVIETIENPLMRSEWSINQHFQSVNASFTYKGTDLGENLHFGAIVKSVDGGKSWRQVYKTSDYYVNMISCLTEDMCMAVAEQPNEAVVLRTEDGGAHWNTMLTLTDSKMASLMGCRMISESEVWVSGGTFDKGLQGWFYHSTDGGQTWEKSMTPGASIGLAFKNNVGYSPSIYEFHSAINVYK